MGLLCPRKGDSDEAARENLKVILSELQQLKLDGSIVDLGSGTFPEKCTIDKVAHVGFCLIFFRDVKVREDITSGVTINIETVKTKARVFFQPDAFVLHDFEEVFIPYFVFNGVTELNGHLGSFQQTGEQKATAERLLWSGLNQDSLQCYRI